MSMVCLLSTCDGLELFVLDLQVDALVDLVAPALVLRSNGSRVSSSTSCWRSRLPVFLLICRSDTRSADEEAGDRAMGQETRESFR
jgi:hypothetical protein